LTKDKFARELQKRGLLFRGARRVVRAIVDCAETKDWRCSERPSERARQFPRWGREVTIYQAIEESGVPEFATCWRTQAKHRAGPTHFPFLRIVLGIIGSRLDLTSGVARHQAFWNLDSRRPSVAVKLPRSGLGARDAVNFRDGRCSDGGRNDPPPRQKSCQRPVIERMQPAEQYFGRGADYRHFGVRRG
jgi:hypothetical protein